MSDARSLDDIKDLGSGIPVPDGIARLYHEAFEKFAARALWNWREMERPTVAQALAIASSLRVEGNLQARSLAFQIESACRAAL